MSRRSAKRQPLFLLSLLIFVGSACSSSLSCGSCAGIGPIPGTGWYQGPKSDDPVAVKLSAAGIAYINANWQSLVDSFVPGGVLNVPIPCSIINGGSVFGNFVIADQGRPGCSDPSCGQLDGACDTNPSSPTYDAPANLPVQVTYLNLTTGANNTLTATVNVAINSPQIYVDTVDRNYVACLGLSPATCEVQFQNNGENPAYNTFGATLQFSINNTWDKLLAFKLQAVNGVAICGSGAPAYPNCIDVNEVNLGGVGVCGDVWCGLANFVLDFILPYVAPLINDFINVFVQAQTCQQCGAAGDLSCMQVPTDTSTCLLGVCADNQNIGSCVPRFVGLQGRVTPALLPTIGKYGIPSTSKMDLSMALGSAVNVDSTGMFFSTRGGVNAVGLASCVPDAGPPPALIPLQAPDFDADAPQGSTYHVALGISQPFMNQAAFEAQQSGTLCLDVTSSQFGIINTGTFKLFLPSLGLLATRDGNDAPMLIALRPQTPPTVAVGAGTYDPTTKQPIDPLLTLTMKNLTIDFYAMFDDKYAELFSLTADVQLPLSLIPNGCSSIEPAIGNLQMLVTNIRTSGSKMLAEDPNSLAQLIPAVLGFAQPALAGLLSGLTLPQFSGFQLKIDAAKGVQQVGTSGSYNYLGVYAELLPTGAMCAVGSPTARATLARSVIPNGSQMQLQAGKTLPTPTAILDVSASGMKGTPEYSYRIDNGFWHDFQLLDPSGQASISDPMFLIQGTHQIDVRVRMAEAPRGISAPVTVGFFVDWTPPDVALTVDPTRNTIDVVAHDSVLPSDELQYAYQVGPEGAWSAYGPIRPIDLSAIDDAGGLTVRARNQVGLIGEASYRPAVAMVQSHASQIASAKSAQGAGCSSSGDVLGLFGLLGGTGLLWRRRRRRS